VETQQVTSPARRWSVAGLSFLAVVAVAVYVIASHWPAGGASLGLPWWTHGLLLLAVVVELSFRGMKISFAAGACGIRLGPGTAVRATLCGDFLDAIAPARLGAEPARYLVLREAGVPIAGALVTLFLELLLELLALVVIAVVLVALLPWSAALASLAGMVGAYGAFVTGVAALGWFGGRRDGRAPPPDPGRAPGMTGRADAYLRRAARHLHSGVSAVRHARLGVLAVALACSILHVLARLTILPIILLSAGATVALTPVVLWPLVLLYAGALAPAPSGGGVMEFGFSAALGDVIPAELVAASLIWWRFYSFFIYVLLGAAAAGRTAVRVIGGDGAEPPR
jgi:uncharacterized membrane protein YbhN (UPF0104 family)